MNIPKVDLHCHLDGSVSLRTMKKLAEHLGKEIPYTDKQLRNALIVPDDCESLVEYLKRFALPLEYLADGECFSIACYELMKEAADEGVMYIEIRFAPSLSETEELSAEQIVEKAIAGVRKAERDFDIRGNIILSFMRHEPVRENLALFHRLKKYIGKGVCAIDIAGDEAGFPTHTQAQLFETAAAEHTPFTIHAGEQGSVENIRTALELGAKRIGHGIALVKDKELRDRCVKDKIGIEMCPTSNLQTKAIGSIAQYPIKQFLDEGLYVTLNTDNRMVSDTTESKELDMIKEQFQIAELQLVQNAIEVSFADEDTKRWMREKLSKV